MCLNEVRKRILKKQNTNIFQFSSWLVPFLIFTSLSGFSLKSSAKDHFSEKLYLLILRGRRKMSVLQALA